MIICDRCRVSKNVEEEIRITTWIVHTRPEFDELTQSNIVSSFDLCERCYQLLKEKISNFLKDNKCV